MVPFFFSPPPGSTLLLPPPVVLRSFGPVWGATSAARPKECSKKLLLGLTSIIHLVFKTWREREMCTCLRQPGLRVHLLGTHSILVERRQNEGKKSVFLDVYSHQWEPDDAGNHGYILSSCSSRSGIENPSPVPAVFVICVPFSQNIIPTGLLSGGALLLLCIGSN